MQKYWNSCLNRHRPTKTLAKITSRISKKSAKADGVVDLTPNKHRDLALEMIAIEDVWGIGILPNIMALYF